PLADNRDAASELFGQLEDDLSADAGGYRPGDGVHLRLAILPPLCDVRLLELPGLRDDEIERVLRRDASRHFLTGGRSVVVGGVRIDGGRQAKEGSAPVLAAAVPSALLDALDAAATARGWD